MTTSPENAFDAVAAIGKALEKLTEDDRGRALRGAAVALGIQLGVQQEANGVGQKPADPSSNAGGPPAADGRKVSLVEFLNTANPATNPQRIAVFAAYRSQVEGNDRFSRRDLAAYFSRAKLSPPKNFDRDYTTAVKEGWIHDDEEQSYLTSTGEGQVRNGFDGKGKARGKTVKKKPKKAKE
jgi:hypothetical protein